MINAKDELIKAVVAVSRIKCATISYNPRYDSTYSPINLRLGHSKHELNTFLSSIDFEYDNGYGCQELCGTVWLNDNTWLERGEYDGSEWWDHHVCPNIPEELK